VDVVDNERAGRFEVRRDGELAELVYRRTRDQMVLVHTEVPEALNGHGIGGALVEAAIDDAARRGLTVIPQCPFARSWLERHPEVAQRVTIQWP
jgi:predicted GNAT family acetyltransferase